MKFTKMQACGNDFIVVDAFTENIPDPQSIAERLCDRHFGIGADGLILVCPSDIADTRMRIINADGGEVNMCGNGVRCAAKFAYDNGICSRTRMSMETGAGIKYLDITPAVESEPFLVTVDMGVPDTDPKHYPLLADDNHIIIRHNEKDIHFFCVNTGVPHAVTFDIFPEGEEFLELGARLEHYPLFPERSNICFGRVDDRTSISARIWERGCGPTLACGTGSCAMLYAGIIADKVGREADIILPGGVLHDLLREDDHLMMTGPAVTVYEGNISI